MSRKSLVKVATVSVLLLVLVGGLVSLACSKKSATTGDITVTSSVNAGHTHQVTISGTDINNPPAADKTIDTTYSAGHFHTIILTTQDYESIQSGNEVTVVSSSVSGHTHTFVIKK
jgi:hypothetical protein